MHSCTRCGSSVGDAFRYCPWCAAPQRLKLVEFFRARDPDATSKALRVSRYLHDDLEERHVRFSIWGASPEELAGRARASEANRGDPIDELTQTVPSWGRRRGVEQEAAEPFGLVVFERDRCLDSCPFG
jgi:hypothetical protein